MPWSLRMSKEEREEFFEQLSKTVDPAEMEDERDAKKRKKKNGAAMVSDEPEGQLAIDMYQTQSEVVIQSHVAGVPDDELDISVTNDMVTIRGRRERMDEINEDGFYYQECFWGSFARSILLPVEVSADEAKATLKNGLLTIRLPKSEKIKTKKISIKAEA